MLNKPNILRLILLFAFLPLIIVSGCTTQDLALHRLNQMKPTAYFDTQLQIDLADAINKSDTNKMQTLITSGADVNYLGRDDMRPLFWALAKQNIQAFTFLLDHGANPNVVAEHPSLESALDLAVCMSNSEYLEELLKHGANPNAVLGNTPQTAQTAIFSAILNNRINNIALLLKYGANIEWKTANGTTPLHNAIYSNSYEAALFLCHAGANPLVKNKLGYNPVETMEQFGDNGVLSRADEKAYKQLLEEFRKAGLLDKPSQPSTK